MTKHIIVFLALAFVLTASAWGQAFNCTSFASTGGTSGACGADVVFIANTGQPFGIVGTPTSGGPYPVISGGKAVLVPQASIHIGLNLNYMTPVNIQAFTDTFTFIPNGWNLALVLQNNTNTSQGGPPATFAAGAGCEGSFYQAFGSPWLSGIPTNIIALNIDEVNGISSANQNPLSNSTVQMYGESMSPCNPNDAQTFFYITSKISTSPVSLLTSSAPVQFTGVIAGTVLTASSVTGTLAVGMTIYGNGTGLGGDGVYVTSFGTGTGGAGTYNLNSSLTIGSEAMQGVNSCFETVAGTCDTWISTVGYDGANLSICLASTTAGNNCTSSTTGTGTFFTNTWNGVNIPSMVDGTTAYVGLSAGAGKNGPTGLPLDVLTWSHTVNTATTPNFGNGPYTGQPLATANPTASPVAGSYSGSQTVTLSDSTPNSYICYLQSSSVPAMPPQTDNHGGCIVGTVYSTPVAVSSSTHLYAQAGNPGNIGNTTGGQFSAVMDNQYTISTGTDSTTGVTFKGVQLQ